MQGIGIAIGPGAQSTVQVFGDLHYHPVTLRAPLREAFNPLLDDRTRLFAGRDDPLREIARFLEDPVGGYLVLTAPAGFGKTAVAAWLACSAGEHLAYHFFSPLYGASGLREEFFLRSMVEQLAEWHGHREAAPKDVFELRGLYHRFLAEPLDRPRAILLDGLDEVCEWPLRPYLPGRLGTGLHVLLTIRDVGQDWGGDYGLSRERIAVLALRGLDREQVAAVMAAAGPRAATAARDGDLLDQLMRVAVYRADAELGADPFYVRLLAEDVEAGRLTRVTAGARPAGLDAYLDAWWQDVRTLANAEGTRDLFGTLTVARGPIGRRELEAVNPSLVDDFDGDAFSAVVGGVRRFVAGDDHGGYALAHPRLQEYMRTRVRTQRYEDRLIDHCRRWREHLAPYALDHLPTHLAQQRRLEELQALVLDVAGTQPTWYGARTRQSDEGYASDVRMAWRLTAQADEERTDAKQRVVAAAGSETRCALALGSLSSLAGNVPPALAAALVGHDAWTVERALAYARRIPDLGQRAETLVALLRFLGGADWERAVRAALEAVEIAQAALPTRRMINAFPDPFVPGRFAIHVSAPSRAPAARALAALDARLDGHEELLGAAVDAWNDHWTYAGDPQVEVLEALTPVLPAHLLERALSLVRWHTDPETRARDWSGIETAANFAVLARHLPVPDAQIARHEAVSAALREGNLAGLTAVAPLVPDDQLDEFVDAGLAAALERDHQAWYRSYMAGHRDDYEFEGYVSDADRVRWIEAIARRMGDGARVREQELLGCLERPAYAAWAAAVLDLDEPEPLLDRALGLGGDDIDLLHGLAARLPGHMTARWLDCAARARPEYGNADAARSRALAVMASHAPEPLLEPLLLLTAGLGTARRRAQVLQALAPRLAPPLLEEAARIAATIGDAAVRARIVAALADAASPQTRSRLGRRAVALAVGAAGSWHEPRVFEALAPHLGDEELERVLRAVACSAEPADESADRWRLLPPARAHIGLRVIPAMAEPKRRAAALVALMPRLADARLADALAEARGLPADSARALVMVEVLRRLPQGAERTDLRDEVFTLLRELPVDGPWLRALVELALTLPDPPQSALLRFAVQLIDGRLIDGDEARDALEVIAERGAVTALPAALERCAWFRGFAQQRLLRAFAARHGPVFGAALEQALAMEHPWYRMRALAGFAAHSEGDARREILRAELDALIEAAPDDWGDIEMFGDPGSYRPLGELVALEPGLAAEALHVMADHLNPLQLDVALGQVVPKLPEELVGEAAGLARRAAEGGVASSLPVVAGRLPPEQRESLLAEAVTFSYGTRDLMELAAQRPPDVLTRMACDEIRRLGQGYTEAFADVFHPLSRALEQLPPAAVHEIWITALREFSGRDRETVFRDLEWFAPYIVRAGGDTAAVAIADAVEAAGRLWP